MIGYCLYFSSHSERSRALLGFLAPTQTRSNSTITCTILAHLQFQLSPHMARRQSFATTTAATRSGAARTSGATSQWSPFDVIPPAAGARFDVSGDVAARGQKLILRKDDQLHGYNRMCCSTTMTISESHGHVDAIDDQI